MIEYRTKKKDTFVGAWLGGDNGNIIFGCGLPQYLDKYNPLIAQIDRLHYNLFVPRYQGSFESGGDFNIFSSVQTIEDCIALVNEGCATELFGENKIIWNGSAPLYVMGYSYGSLPALLSSNEKIEKTILICPFVDIHFHLKDTPGENMEKTLVFIERAYPNLYRLHPDQVMKSFSNVTLPEKKENLVIVSALADTSIPKEEIDFLSHEYPNARFVKKDGGHNAQLKDELFCDILNKNIIR